jgi:predicted acetyltransferase
VGNPVVATARRRNSNTNQPQRNPDAVRPMRLETRKALPDDFAAVQQMLELYQYELSDIWPQDADAQALYGYDLTRHRLGERFHAHVAVQGSQYVGCALVAPAAVTRQAGSWMEQFFVLKRYRRTGAGRALAEHVLRAHPGLWEVGQMPQNRAAQAFWRQVVGAFTQGRYTELTLTAGSWQGVVQQFEVPAEPLADRGLRRATQ